MSHFEIELRGLLSLAKKRKLEDFLAENGKLIKEYKRFQWIFNLSHHKKIDLRIKNTNGQCEFSLKTGASHKANRKEISIPFAADKIDQALEFLKYLKQREGLTAQRNAKIFDYKGIEWAVVEVPKHSYYFEAEKLVASKEQGKKAENEIREVTKELGLDVMTQKQTIEYIKKLDKEANKKFEL